MNKTNEPMLRPIEDRDGPGLARLLGGILAEYVGCVLDIDAEEDWLHAPAQRLERGWAVEQDGRLIGCIALSTREDGVVLLKKCYVHRAARGQGLGRRLIACVIEAAVTADAPAVELWSDTRFERAHHVYEAAGFVATGAQRRLDDLSDTEEFHYRLLLGSEEA